MFWKRDLGNININGIDYKAPKMMPLVGGLFGRFLVYFGIILPTLAMLFETQFHVCARHFFDPFPSNTHTLLFSMVPIAGVLSWLCLSCSNNRLYGLALFANGMAVGIAILYTLMFAPLMPVSASWLLYLGFGLLGFAPALSLLALWRAGKHLQKSEKSFGGSFHAPQVVHAGHLVILATVLAIELPSTLTRVGMNMAGHPETQEQGLAILRMFGNQEVMLRACYERAGRATDVLGSLYEVSHPANVDVMRNIFYKATGRTFNSFPIPEAARGSMRNMGMLAYDGMDQGAEDEFDHDPDVAGEMVSGVSRGLSVTKSRIEGNFDADAGVGQIDWFLDFNNKSKYDREVRTRIKLPHGAAVNRASLIVNGKEFDCQITLREEAREIYRAAVESKRNPLLVSTCAEDTVLVQCYPVPPGNGLKLHLQAVTPLELNKDMKGVLPLPQFEERNFQINVPHSISLQANHEISSKWGQFKNEKNGDKFVMKGDIDPGALATGSGIITFDRSKEKEFFTKDNFSGSFALNYKGSRPVVAETIGDIGLKKPHALVVLVDLSICMKDQMKEIVEALKKLPPDMLVQITCVGDKGTESLSNEYVKVSSQEFSDSLKKLSEKECIGGQTDDRLGQIVGNCNENSAVLWIHGAQPTGGSSISVLNYLNHPALYDMQVSSGPNVFLDGLTARALVRVPRFGSAGDDLAFLFEEWKTPGSMKKFQRNFCYAIAPASKGPENGKQEIDGLIVPGRDAQGNGGGGVPGGASGGMPAGISGNPGTSSGASAGSEGSIGNADTAVSSISCEVQPAVGGVANAGVTGAEPACIDVAEPVPGIGSVRVAPVPEPAPMARCAPRVFHQSLSDGPFTVIAHDDPVYGGKGMPDMRSGHARGKETMGQLAQLYAIDQINNFIKNHNDAAALQLAGRYHLVTPVSSAVLVDTVPDLERMSCVMPAMSATPEREFLQNLANSLSSLNLFDRLNSCDGGTCEYKATAPGYPAVAPPVCIAPQTVTLSEGAPEAVSSQESLRNSNEEYGTSSGREDDSLDYADAAGSPDPGSGSGYGNIGGAIAGSGGSGSGGGGGGPRVSYGRQMYALPKSEIAPAAMPAPSESSPMRARRKAKSDYSTMNRLSQISDYRSAGDKVSNRYDEFSAKKQLVAKEAKMSYDAPALQGASNGTIGPQGADAIAIEKGQTETRVRGFMERAECEKPAPAPAPKDAEPYNGRGGAAGCNITSAATGCGAPGCAPACDDVTYINGVNTAGTVKVNPVPAVNKPIVFSCEKPVYSQSASGEADVSQLYNENGEINPMAVVQRFWFIIIGLFAFVYAVVHRIVQKLGLS